MDRPDAKTRILEALVGEACFNAMAGDADDYALVLDLGEKQRRTLRLANPRLSFLQRTYEGTHSLLVECPWRIDAPDAVVATCFDVRKDDGAAERAFEGLTGRKVVAVLSESPGHDLVLRFEDGWALRTLATESDLTGPRQNWQCWTPLGLVTVGPRSKVAVQSLDEARDAFRRLRLAPFEGVDDDVDTE